MAAAAAATFTLRLLPLLLRCYIRLRCRLRYYRRHAIDYDKLSPILIRFFAIYSRHIIATCWLYMMPPLLILIICRLRAIAMPFIYDDFSLHEHAAMARHAMLDTDALLRCHADAPLFHAALMSRRRCTGYAYFHFAVSCLVSHDAVSRMPLRCRCRFSAADITLSAIITLSPCCLFYATIDAA